MRIHPGYKVSYLGLHIMSTSNLFKARKRNYSSAAVTQALVI